VHSVTFLHIAEGMIIILKMRTPWSAAEENRRIVNPLERKRGTGSPAGMLPIAGRSQIRRGNAGGHGGDSETPA